MMTETLANIHISKQYRRERSPSLNGAPLPKMLHLKTDGNVKRSGSLVFGQKLRESKWFREEELRIFCAVVETGFIIEAKDGDDAAKKGIAIWTPTYEKSKNSDYLTIHTTVESKGRLKVVPLKLNEFWPNGTLVRINNSSDKNQTPLAEEVIRNQVIVAEGTRKKWHNNEHFVYFCRYGPVESANLRIRKITDQLRWNTGTFFLRIRRLTAK